LFHLISVINLKSKTSSSKINLVPFNTMAQLNQSPSEHRASLLAKSIGATMRDFKKNFPWTPADDDSLEALATKLAEVNLAPFNAIAVGQYRPHPVIEWCYNEAHISQIKLPRLGIATKKEVHSCDIQIVAKHVAGQSELMENVTTHYQFSLINNVFHQARMQPGAWRIQRRREREEFTFLRDVSRLWTLNPAQQIEQIQDVVIDFEKISYQMADKLIDAVEAGKKNKLTIYR